MKRPRINRPVRVPCMAESERFFSYFVRHLRRQRGYTQTQVAELTGYSPSYISGVENGGAYRNIAKTHRIIYAIGGRPEVLHECTARIMQLRRHDTLD